jgi:hypothetical protein
MLKTARSPILDLYRHDRARPYRKAGAWTPEQVVHFMLAAMAAGDFYIITVNIPSDTMHWHGAAPDRLFSHLALSEAGEQGQGAAWGAHVSDAEYNEAATGG